MLGRVFILRQASRALSNRSLSCVLLLPATTRTAPPASAAATTCTKRCPNAPLPSGSTCHKLRGAGHFRSPAGGERYVICGVTGCELELHGTVDYFVRHMERIVVIDGASSSGRTSLVRMLAETHPPMYRTYHIDDFIGGLPEETWDRCSRTDVGWCALQETFSEFLFARKAIDSILVADSFFKLQRARDHLYSLFGRHNVYHVQLFCALEELERRDRRETS